MRPDRRTFFCDTSVIVAAIDEVHVHHVPSLAVVRRATRDTAFCWVHALAEVYSTLTAPRYQHHPSPAEVKDFIRRIRNVFTVVSLSPAESEAALERGADLGVRNGTIYDLLHLRAAEKSTAAVVYTWNTKHFRALATPESVERIRTP